MDLIKKQGDCYLFFKTSHTKKKLIHSLKISDNCELKWQPNKNQLDKMILPAYTDITKHSLAHVNKFGCPPEYVVDMLRDIADALTSIHPECESEGGCSCY